MINSNTDTITAIATAEGQGGVGIIRVSGPKTRKIAEALLGKTPEPRIATFAKFKNIDGELLDHGVALLFQAPHSFTGEDVLELQGHGGPVILDRVLKATLQAGARLAEPGEFSKRAFLNDKIDLAQAEAIADLIASQSIDAAKAAMRSLEGDFSKEIQDIVNALIQLRMYVEAAIDFPEEEIDFLNDGHILSQLNNIIERINILQQKSKQGAVLRDGITLVITGEPNAGKSSLLNALSGEDSAIVTDIPGTTRDVLKEKIILDGIPIHILDTAGIRESHDPVEQEGIKRAKAAIQKAQGVLLVIDAAKTTSINIQSQLDALTSLIRAETPVIIVFNKVDLIENIQKPELSLPCLKISAKTHAGLEDLKKRLKALAGMEQSLEGVFLARRRHLEAIEKAHDFVLLAKVQLEEFRAGELLAEELRQAQRYLSEITGEFTSDDLLGKIFSSFCIGK
ncbi:MAG: tRNA modification GTPase MnmE [Gammaproteobacteria bacterium]|jgi:tRNA modification GTPase|nr:tRNA modification GTPase MnmE [Gammaproteobacteria bacterium]